MNEIKHLNNTAQRIAIPAASAAGANGQRFQQLIAQVPPDGQDWATATAILEGTAYAQQGQLTAAGQSAVREARAQMQQEHGIDISLEMAAKQVLLKDMTSRLAQATMQGTAGSSVLQQQAQQLQTELSEAINELKGPQEIPAEPKPESPQNRLQALLETLNTNRAALERLEIDLGSGPVVVSDLLAAKTTEPEKLDVLIYVAEKQLAKQTQATQQVEGLAQQNQQVDEFLNTVSAEQQQQWSERLGYSVALKPFVLSELQKTGEPLTVASVGQAVEEIWLQLPAVKPVKVDAPIKLLEGEQYDIPLLKTPDTTIQLLDSTVAADYALYRLFESFNRTYPQPGAFHVRLMSYDNQEISSFQVYWNPLSDGRGTTYMTPDGDLLNSRQADVAGALLPMPILQIFPDVISGSPDVERLDGTLSWFNTGSDVYANRPYVKNLLVSVGDSKMYQLPSNARINELAGSLQTLSESPGFWGDQVDQPLTPAQERRLSVANKLRDAQEYVFVNTYPVLARNRARQRTDQFTSNQPVPMTTAEWRSAGMQNNVLDIVERQFPQRITQLQNRISGAGSLREIRHFEQKLKDVYMRIIPLIKPHDQLLMVNTRIDSFVNQGLANLIANGVSFWGADLKGTDLSNLDLRNTNIEYIKHDKNTNWSGALLTEWQISELGLDMALFEPAGTLPVSGQPLGTLMRNFIGINTGADSGTNGTHNTSGSPDTNGPTAYLPNNSGGNDFSDFTVSSRLSFQNPNGLVDSNTNTQSGHDGSGGNNGNKGLTAVAGDTPEPNNPFQVINGQVNVSGIQLPELDLSGNVAQPGESIFGTPVGLPELPAYTPAPRTEEGAADIPVADSGSETTPPIAQQPGGVTIGGQLGNDKGRTAAELGLDPSGKLPGPEKAKAPDPTPGYGEGVNPQDLNQTNTRDWGGGPVDYDPSQSALGGFPQQDKTLEGILNPEGPAGARFRFPPGTEEIPVAEYQAVVKALPALQQISVGEYSQLSSADQNNIISRAVEYQTLAADIKANTSLLQYADSGQTSASQRGQMLGEQQRQTAHTAEQTLSTAQSGLSDSTLQLINSRINALQQNTAAINQQTQVLTQSNANRQNALAAPATSDPVTAAFIKPDNKPGQTPPASNSAPESQISSQSSPIPRFMVVRTANGPQLMENLPSGKTQMLPYPIPADTPVTRQASNGSWTHVPDAYAIGAKNLLDTLFLQGAVKMLNNGNAVQSPGTQSTPAAPTSIPQPAF